MWSRGGMSQPHVLTLLVLLLCCQGPSAQITDNVVERWKEYSEECQRNMSRLPAPTELVCNRTFDKFSCWPDTMPNSTASVPCPWFLPWYHKVKHRHVFKTCGPDGQWVTGPQGQSLRDATQCEQDDEDLKAQEKFAKTYGSFKVMYTVGYSVSLCALLLALALLLGFRWEFGHGCPQGGQAEARGPCTGIDNGPQIRSKLHCMRNYIHMNLFASFILKGVSVLVIDALLKTHYSDKIDGYNVQVWLSDEAAAGCRAATVFMQYGIVANYCWLLVEGIYLHNLLVVAVFSERSYFTLYLCIGWGAPMLFLIPWVIVKFLYENIQCWSTNNNMGFWWILRFPVFLAILVSLRQPLARRLSQAPRWLRGAAEGRGTEVSCLSLPLALPVPLMAHSIPLQINFFIFIRIIQILVSKLRAHQMRYTDYKFRLAKSTLTLIPLLGIHEVVFAFITDEHAQGTLRYVKLFFDLFLSSFQGMLVAILYCFVNKEVSRTAGTRAAGARGHTDSCCPQVQAELLKRWQRWKLGKDLAEEYKHTYSHGPSARNGAGSTCEKHQLVGGCANGLGRSLGPHPGSQRLERSGRSTAEHLALGGHHHCYEFPETTAESHF
ncbi:PREDICTED: glucagon receptor isoform X2 [Sturnus vulgaris]|uniref:glucagon receptor isoform X2 n=1 Tax=Sturnus vulgaris TaxID=9172 RepID=UPI00071A2355|nr:PREDICTED: glucagon receptor isoform X2 [Sturnus vulgaris]